MGARIEHSGQLASESSEGNVSTDALICQLRGVRLHSSYQVPGNRREKPYDHHQVSEIHNV